MVNKVTSFRDKGLLKVNFLLYEEGSKSRVNNLRKRLGTRLGVLDFVFGWSLIVMDCIQLKKSLT